MSDPNHAANNGELEWIGHDPMKTVRELEETTRRNIAALATSGFKLNLTDEDLARDEQEYWRSGLEQKLAGDHYPHNEEGVK